MHTLPKKLHNSLSAAEYWWHIDTNMVYEGKFFHLCSVDMRRLCHYLDSDTNAWRRLVMEDRHVNNLHCSVHRNARLHTR